MASFTSWLELREQPQADQEWDRSTYITALEYGHFELAREIENICQFESAAFQGATLGGQPLGAALSGARDALSGGLDAEAAAEVVAQALDRSYGEDIEAARASGGGPGLLLAVLLDSGSAEFCEAVYVQHPGLFEPEDAMTGRVKNFLPLPVVQVWAAKTFGFDASAHWAHWLGVPGVSQVSVPIPNA